MERPCPICGNPIHVLESEKEAVVSHMECLEKVIPKIDERKRNGDLESGFFTSEDIWK